MSDWIKVKDNLPEMKEREDNFSSDNVLAFDGKNVFVACRWKYKKSKFITNTEEYFKPTICDCCNPEIGKITHWMPLPETPK